MLYRRSPGFLTISRLVEKEVSPEMIDAVENLVEQFPQYESVNDLVTLLNRWVIQQLRPVSHQIVINDEVSQSFRLMHQPSVLPDFQDHHANATASIIPKASAILCHFLDRTLENPVGDQCVNVLNKPDDSLQKEPYYRDQALEEIREALLNVVVPFYCGNRLMGWLGLAAKSDGKDYSVQEVQIICDLLWVYGLFLSRAFRSEKEALLGYIPQGMAHDMRNWLAPVYACIQIQAEGESKSLSKLSKLLPNATQGIELWNYYLLHSTHQQSRALNWKLIRMDALVQRAIKCFTGGDKMAALILERPIAASVFGDEVLLMRLFGNFISNALRLTPEAEEVVLSMEFKQKQEGKTTFIRVYVADKGPGIVPELIKAFYQPTFAALSEESDTNRDGLGLAICRQIAHLHGGCLILEKNEGGGALIGVELPCADSGVAANKP